MSKILFTSMLVTAIGGSVHAANGLLKIEGTNSSITEVKCNTGCKIGGEFDPNLAIDQEDDGPQRGQHVPGVIVPTGPSQEIAPVGSGLVTKVDGIYLSLAVPKNASVGETKSTCDLISGALTNLSVLKSSDQKDIQKVATAAKVDVSSIVRLSGSDGRSVFYSTTSNSFYFLIAKSGQSETGVAEWAKQESDSSDNFLVYRQNRLVRLNDSQTVMAKLADQATRKTIDTAASIGCTGHNFAITSAVAKAATVVSEKAEVVVGPNSSAPKPTTVPAALSDLINRLSNM